MQGELETCDLQALSRVLSLKGCVTNPSSARFQLRLVWLSSWLRRDKCARSSTEPLDCMMSWQTLHETVSNPKSEAAAIPIYSQSFRAVLNNPETMVVTYLPFFASV